MFEALARAVEELEVPSDPSALAEVWALVDRLTAKATMAAAAFDEHELWDVDGDTSLTGWLRHHAGMTSRDAAVVTRTGERLRSAPSTAAAWLNGDLTGGQVAAVVANVHDETAELWAQHEAAVVPTLTPLPVHQVAAAMRVWAQRAEALVESCDGRERASSLHLSRTLEDRAELTGSFSPELADLVTTALRVGTRGDGTREPVRTPAERRAEALGDICQFFLDHQHATTGGRHRPHLNLLVDLDRRAAGDPAAAWTIDGTTTPSETIRRLLCDSGVHRVVTAGRSTIIDYGTRTQTIPAPLFNALVVRDGHCRWAGCDRPASWCDGHHLHHWEDGGPTRLDNLVLLCRRHHTRIHKRGWQIKLLPDATVELTSPDGIVETTRPPPRC